MESQSEQSDTSGKLQALEGGNAAKDQYLTTNVRLDDAVVHAQMTVNTEAAEQSDPAASTARARWRRATFFASRLGDPDKMLEGAGIQESDIVQKNLEEQHWLEMIDSRQASLRLKSQYYHKQWQEADTTENFFKWLDSGEGKDLSLKDCSREQLEKECIIYLSSEQRLNYMVEVDSKGRLRWARTKDLVDTSAGHWKDAGQGRGIVPIDFSDKSEKPPATSSGTSPANEESPEHYLDRQISGNAVTKAIKSNLTRKGVILKLLRKTVQRETWIYVSDKNFNMFVGIKVTGQFQHSSFLAGGIATSAGLITVKHGLIRKLSPLSGHYRTSINHFRQFVRVLNDRGIDMHKAELSKAEIALWGIEHITKWKKLKSHITDETKKEIADATHTGNHTTAKRSTKDDSEHAEGPRSEAH